MTIAPATLGRLVQAVADMTKPAVVIADDNTATCICAVEDALYRAVAGETVAVVPRPHLFALDLDDTNGGVDLAVFDHIHDQLHQAGYDVIVIASGQHNHRHLFASGIDTRLRQRLSVLATKAGIDDRSNTHIRPPGVQHRSGAAPRLLSHQTWEQALEALTGWTHRAVRPTTRPQPGDSSSPEAALVTAAEQSQPDSFRAEPGTELAGVDWDLAELIVHGDRHGRYNNDGSALTMAICNRAANSGMTCAHLARLLADPRHKGGEAYRKRLNRSGTWNGDRWLQYSYDKAKATSWSRAPVRSRPEALEMVAKLANTAAVTEFPGRTGTNRRAALYACFHLAQRYGGIVVPLSVREVAAAAGMADGTAAKMIRELQSEGWLRLVRCSNGTKAAVWALCDPGEGPVASRATSTHSDVPDKFLYDQSDSRNTMNRPAAVADITRNDATVSAHFGGVGLNQECATDEKGTDPTPVRLDPATIGHDAYGTSALNKTGAAAWAAINAGATTAAAVASAISRSVGQTRRVLARLHQAGLIERAGQHWTVTATDRSSEPVPEGLATPARALLDQIAADHHTAGRGRHRQERHRIARECYGKWLEHRAERATDEKAPQQAPSRWVAKADTRTRTRANLRRQRILAAPPRTGAQPRPPSLRPVRGNRASGPSTEPDQGPDHLHISAG